MCLQDNSERVHSTLMCVLLHAWHASQSGPVDACMLHVCVLCARWHACVLYCSNTRVCCVVTIRHKLHLYQAPSPHAHRL